MSTSAAAIASSSIPCAALLEDELAVVLGDHRRDARHGRADHTHLTQQRLEVGTACQRTGEQPLRGLDVGVGEYRETVGHIGKPDRAPQATKLVGVEPRTRRDIGNVVRRPARQHQ